MMNRRGDSLCYLSIDRDNVAQAGKLASAVGIHLKLIEPRDLGQLDGMGVIIDADSIPRTDRDRLFNSAQVQVIAMHGCCLGDDESFLVERGIVTSRQLDQKLFQALAGSALLTSAQRDRKTNPTRVIIGSVCVDRIARVEEVRLQAKNRMKSVGTFLGGGGGNIAVANRRLAPDRRVVLLARVGDDMPGEFACRTLTEQGIDMPLERVAGVPTSFSYIATLAGTGRSTIFSEVGTRAEPVPIEEVERALDHAEVLWLAAVSRNALIRPLTALAARGRIPLYIGLGTIQIEELGYDGLGEELAGPVELLVCNRHEAEVFTGRQKVAEQLQALRYGGRVRTVVITDGEKGIHAWRNGTPYHVGAYRDDRPVVDDTGAGDAAQATIGHCLLSGMAMEEALHGGARQGFECCTMAGAQAELLDAAELRTYLMGRAKVEVA